MPGRAAQVARRVWRRVARTRRPLLALVLVVTVVAIGLIGRALGFRAHSEPPRPLPVHAPAPRVARPAAAPASHTGWRALDAARW